MAGSNQVLGVLVLQPLNALVSLPNSAPGWFGAALGQGSGKLPGVALGDITWVFVYFLKLIYIYIYMYFL